MNVTFEPVRTPEQIDELAELAGAIWHEYWPAIIGEEQTDYMVEKFQSKPAIERDMAESAYEYWFVRVSCEEGACAGGAGDADGGEDAASAGTGRIVGFTGGHDEPETERFFISKIYLLAEERGRGFASRTLAFYEQLCRERGWKAMYLTVNKHNELGIRAYKGKGFETIDAVETDIGGGFVMDDYIMEKKVG